MLSTTGELARVAGPALRPHMAEVLPLIIDAIQDPSASVRRNVAVVTLGQVGCCCLASPSAALTLHSH